MPAPRPLRIERLGRIGYAAALDLQERLVEERVEQRIPDTVLLLEHDPPVVTLGRGAKPEHVLASAARLAELGIERFETGRGGDVTYHGPGQLVAYPIFDLSPDRRDVRKYVTALEEVMIRTTASYGLDAARIAGLPGIFVAGNKLGALGVRIRRWVTLHGIALNVSTDLDAFDLIVPCGLRDHGVTSLERELGGPAPLREVEERLIEAFAEVFGAAPS
jgi:lipoyl(octanoyl) transferase